MHPAKVLIVDDHTLFRHGVRGIVEHEADFEVIGEAENGRQALTKARELVPDLILMDIRLPDDDGLQLVGAVKEALPAIKIIVLTAHDEDENLLEAIRQGAEGFLIKNLRGQSLLNAMRGVIRGEAILSGRMATKVIKEYRKLARARARDDLDQLTGRENQVLQKIEEGLSTREVALALHISESTVRSHVTSILSKLHLQSRFEAVEFVRRQRELLEVSAAREDAP